MVMSLGPVNVPYFNITVSFSDYRLNGIYHADNYPKQIFVVNLSLS